MDLFTRVGVIIIVKIRMFISKFFSLHEVRDGLCVYKNDVVGGG